MKICGIYKIVNKIDGKCYIGSSNNIHRRFYIHVRKLNDDSHENPYLQNAWNKYGSPTFQLIVVEECDCDVLLIREQIYLNDAKNNESLYYNLNFTSTKPPSPKGRIISKLTRKKLSITKTGTNNHMYGKTVSDVVRSKMSISHTKNIYIFVCPDNKIVSIKNLKQFCKINKLNEGGMYGVQKERYVQYKGWKKYNFEKI
jgi:group I intron endonuclease